MALRVLTAQEKESLAADFSFRMNCQWALRDYAAYWSVHDGSGLSTEADRIKWAKDRINSVALEQNDFVSSDSQLGLKMCKLAKAMQIDLAAAPEAAETIVTAMSSANKFEELASLYFDMLGESINFSKTGN